MTVQDSPEIPMAGHVPSPVMMSRIQAGAKLLDERVPGWRRTVATDRLVMADPYYCIVAQVMGRSYGMALMELMEGHLDFYQPGTGIKYGFETDNLNEGPEYDYSYPDLSAGWEQEILHPTNRS